MKLSNLLLTPLTVMVLSACAGTPDTSAPANRQPQPDTHKVATNTAASSSSAVSADFESRPLSANQNEFIQEVAERYQIPQQHVSNLVHSAQINAQTQRLMAPSSKGRVKRSWTTYRNRVMDPIRVRGGQGFMQRNASTLRQVEQHYGVPKEIIGSIIGVETVYGKYMGDFRLLDALYTLGFYHPDPNRPDRHQSFRNQLAALIKLDHQGKLSAQSELGSFAGATGLPQFMPISIMHFAVDGDGDGRIDLRHSEVDAIHSVANFLVKHGWQRGMPVFAPASLPSNPAAVEGKGLEPTLTWQELQAQGSTSKVANATWQNGRVLGVINLMDETSGRNEYRIATQNFFAITKYNNSYFYAASVADFAETLK
ncbi:Membrane-bound lytic murein transglycosylase B precursor [Oligella urethralis]|uniref:lytic murein transglycosylase B n=1 Tax=Oligella urethralis TaxID=90245 RepID=UPI000DFD2238|nr:lytic murein transglycosylase B [Oligella urethralis]SUA60081.1 Membrane-bound lytic murein transglycosylase B precursor [Oligella urethralis]